MNIALFLAFLLHVTKVTSQSLSKEFPHFSIFDRENNFQLYWEIDDVFITFEVSSRQA